MLTACTFGIRAPAPDGNDFRVEQLSTRASVLRSMDHGWAHPFEWCEVTATTLSRLTLQYHQ